MLLLRSDNNKRNLRKYDELRFLLDRLLYDADEILNWYVNWPKFTENFQVFSLLIFKLGCILFLPFACS